MRSIAWLGSGMAALLFAFAAIVGLRGGAPLPKPAAPAAVSAPAPVKPAAAKPAESAAAAVRPSFDIVRIDPQGQAVIAGRAAPGDQVRVLDGDKTLGEVTADARGEWVLLPQQPVAPGNRQLSLEATGPNGGAPRRSADVVALSVLPSAAAGRGPSAVAVLLPGDANKPARVLQQPVPAAGPQALSLDSAAYGAGGEMVLSGHAAPGTRLNLYAGAEPLGSATADADGRWSLASPRPVPAGKVELRLDELAADGSVARSVNQPFAPSGAMPAAGTYTVARGNSLWLIARHIYGRGTRYTTIYTVNRGLIRDPDRIYPGQVFKLPPS
jgi:nucleoid-associated protein YgaU